jgi:hypothetical protein
MNDRLSPERLSKELRNRANETGGHPISFEDVKRSARKMKWQQRAAAGGVAAVVLAIAVPVGFAVVRNDDKGNPQFANPSPTVTKTPTPTPTPTPGNGKTVLTLVGAPQGAAPKVTWLQGRTAHLSDGGTATLPKAYIDLGAYHGGWLAIGFKNGEYTLDRIDASGKVTSSRPGSDSFAVSVDGTQLTWWEDGRLTTGIPSGMGDGETTVRTPAGEQVHLVGYASGGEVVYQTYGTDPAVYVTDFQGAPRRLDGALAAGGVSQETGVLSVQTSSSDTGSCWDVRKVGTGEVVWHTCKYQVRQFSLDGRYAIAYDSYGDGLGPRQLYVLDASDGKLVAAFEGPAATGAFVSDAVWEADSHNVLAEVYENGKWQLARLGLDGSIETASDALPGEDVSPVFAIASRP